MTEQNKYVPEVEDFVTVTEWINSDDKSYKRDIFKVVAIDENLIYCKFLTRKSQDLILDSNEVVFRQVSKDFALTIINNRD